MTFDELDRIKATASQLVEISRSLPSNPEPHRAGIHLTLATRYFAEATDIDIGTVPDKAKRDKYQRLAREKAFRLEADWCRDPEHTVSSWQTRDDKLERYPGAVLIPIQSDIHYHWIISASGFVTGALDEALSLTLGYALGVANEDTTRRIARVSNNLVFPEMLGAYLTGPHLE
jgi:hypothetical protein